MSGFISQTRMPQSTAVDSFEPIAKMYRPKIVFRITTIMSTVRTAPLTATWPVRQPGPDLSHAWLIVERPSDRFGHPLQISLGLRDCVKTAGGNVTCLAHKGGAYAHAVYQPASRFWVFQGIETALFGGVAVALILFAAWWIHARTD